VCIRTRRLRRVAHRDAPEFPSADRARQARVVTHRCAIYLVRDFLIWGTRAGSAAARELAVVDPRGGGRRGWAITVRIPFARCGPTCDHAESRALTRRGPRMLNPQVCAGAMQEVSDRSTLVRTGRRQGTHGPLLVQRGDRSTARDRCSIVIKASRVHDADTREPLYAPSLHSGAPRHLGRYLGET
jgi:hypothetical protein